MIYFKVHKTEKGDMIAMCDEELLGKEFSEGKVILDLKTYSDFYKGELMSKKQIASALDVAALYSANIVGKESVEVMLEKGVVEEDSVKTVKKVPFVQVYKII
ncbi:MAG: DUF424 family protein [Candidatus Micrarchaeota archaeon]|nr:DUF424 family protein [Candidatus Micrarchaeota archaeon]